MHEMEASSGRRLGQSVAKRKFHFVQAQKQGGRGEGTVQEGRRVSMGSIGQSSGSKADCNPATTPVETTGKKVEMPDRRDGVHVKLNSTGKNSAVDVQDGSGKSLANVGRPALCQTVIVV
jgi:hypothetical protein